MIGTVLVEAHDYNDGFLTVGAHRIRIDDSMIKTLIVVTVDEISFTVIAEGDTRPLTAKLQALFKKPIACEIKRVYRADARKV